MVSAQELDGVDVGKAVPPLVSVQPATVQPATVQPATPGLTATSGASRTDMPVTYMPADGPWYANHEMRLRTDGNLPGQLRAFDSAGNLSPVRARLFFLQNGKIIARAASEESGNFQVIGLDEGVYSVIVAGPEGLGAFAIRVLPKIDNAPPPRVKSIVQGQTVAAAENEEAVDNNPDAEEQNQGLVMDVSLVPPPDFQTTSQIFSEQIPGFTGGFGLPGGVPGGAPLAGGGGVGGGGGGALASSLIAAGAAGGIAAAIASNNDNNNNDMSNPTP